MKIARACARPEMQRFVHLVHTLERRQLSDDGPGLPGRGCSSQFEGGDSDEDDPPRMDGYQQRTSINGAFRGFRARQAGRLATSSGGKRKPITRAAWRDRAALLHGCAVFATV